MAEIASPISGGIRAVRSTVASNIITGGARPQQQQEQPQVDGSTTRLLTRNSLLLNSVVVQLGSVTQQVTGLRNSLDVLKENLIVESRLEKLREQARAVRENQIAEQQLREGGESAIEKKIQANLVRPFSKIASKAQITLNRLGRFFTTLFFGWLATNTVRALGALSDDNRQKFNEIVLGVGKVLLILGGAFIASKIGIGKLLTRVITFNFKLKKFSAVGILTAPFRWIGNIINAILNRIGNWFPWLIPGFFAAKTNATELGPNKVNIDGNKNDEKLDEKLEEVQAKNEGGLIDYKKQISEIMNNEQEIINPVITKDENPKILTFEDRLRLFDEKTNILKKQNVKLNENQNTLGDNLQKLQLEFNKIFFGQEYTKIEDLGPDEDITPQNLQQPIAPYVPEIAYVDFGFNETGSTETGIKANTATIEEKKQRIQDFNREEDNTPVIIPLDQGSGSSQSGNNGSTLPIEANSVPPVGAINQDNFYVYNSYKVFQISPR